MTLTIDLTTEETRRFAAAGIDIARLLKSVAASLPDKALPSENAEAAGKTTQDATLALFAQWAAEDAKITPEELEAGRRLFEQFKKNVNDTRKASGMRTL